MFQNIQRKWHTDWFQLFLDRDVTRLDWTFISSNENLLPEMVIQYPSLPWNLNALCSNPNLTISFIKKWMMSNRTKRLNWFSLSKNPRITTKDVSHHPELPWDWKGLSRNPSILSDHNFVRQHLSKMDREHIIKKMPLSFLLQHSVHYFFSHIFWKCVCVNPTLTTQFVLDNLQEDWHWPSLSCHPSCTPEFIESHPDFPWDWKSIGCNDSITPDFVERHIHKQWDWVKLSQNRSMIPLILSHPEYPWNWYIVSSNPSLTKELVQQFKDKEWDWPVISMHLPFTKQDLDEYKNISYNFLSFNEHLTPDMVRQRSPETWTWSHLCRNTMKAARNTYIQNATREHLKHLKESIEMEIMEVAWRPERLQWVLDNDQKKLYSLED
jgi:hypothetical protein